MEHIRTALSFCNEQCLAIQLREVDETKCVVDGFRVRIKGTEEWMESSGSGYVAYIIPVEGLQEGKIYEIEAEVLRGNTWEVVKGASFPVHKIFDISAIKSQIRKPVGGLRITDDIRKASVVNSTNVKLINIKIDGDVL